MDGLGRWRAARPERAASFNDILVVRALASLRWNPQWSCPPQQVMGSRPDQLIHPHSLCPACLCPMGNPDVDEAIEFYSMKSHQIIEGHPVGRDSNLDRLLRIMNGQHGCRWVGQLGLRHLSHLCYSLQLERKITLTLYIRFISLNLCLHSKLLQLFLFVYVDIVYNSIPPKKLRDWWSHSWDTRSSFLAHFDGGTTKLGKLQFYSLSLF